MMNLRSRVIRLAHARPELRPALLPLLRKEAGVLSDWAQAARLTMEAHARDAQRDDDYRKTLEEFIDMERDAIPNARKTRGGMKALEDVKATKAQYRI